MMNDMAGGSDMQVKSVTFVVIEVLCGKHQFPVVLAQCRILAKQFPSFMT